MMRRLKIFVSLIVLALFSLHCTNPPSAPPTPEEAARDIQTYYENNMFRLSPRKQGHLGARFYRITGDIQFVNPSLFYYLVMKRKFLDLVKYFDKPDQISAFVLSWLPKSPATDKEKIRKEVMLQYPEAVFAMWLLHDVYLIHDFNMRVDVQDSYDRAMAYLFQFPFKKYLLETDLLTFYTAKVINAVYFLKFLGLVDLEQDLIEKFQANYMALPDSELDAVKYENKIYGLTHFVIAASNFYQIILPSERFQWILDYLARNIDEIIQRSKADVIAEVGLSFKLCGLPQHPVVEKTRAHLLKLYQPSLHGIASSRGTMNLNQASHRNIISYMVFTPFTVLYPGPDLSLYPYGVSEATKIPKKTSS